jgi:hypothetical protein
LSVVTDDDTTHVAVDEPEMWNKAKFVQLYMKNDKVG